MTEDMEMKAWVVQSDIGAVRCWLKLNILKDRTSRFDITDEQRLAHWFSDFDEAQRVANDWSVVPGVWRVERATIRSGRQQRQ